MKTYPHHSLAKTPPMGWNSWNCYGASVRENEVKQNALYMAQNLKQYGWEYVIVDIQWYEPNAKSDQYNENAPLVMDEYSRLMPAQNRFPCAKDGNGLKGLADYVHSLGLKFGIHIMRGIPKQAVKAKTPIMCPGITADMIADTSSTCQWNGDMYGIDASKKGAREYYESIFKLYASWEIDYVKVDDIARPYHYEEVELIRNAIDKTGRDIVLSLSPGKSSLKGASHLMAHANLWRMSDDFWDTWRQLRETFDLCRDWQNLRTPGAWPDCDMLTVGKIGIRSNGGARMTNFTPDEQKTHIALWCIFRSPMFIGCEMTENDDFTLSLLTNEKLLRILNCSCNNRELYRDEDGAVCWYAEDIDGERKYLAQFNVGEAERTISTPLHFINLEKAHITELYTNAEESVSDSITSKVPSHGVCIYEIK